MGRLAFGAPNQGLESSFCCWLAWQRFAQKERVSPKHAFSPYTCFLTPMLMYVTDNSFRKSDSIHRQHPEGLVYRSCCLDSSTFVYACVNIYIYIYIYMCVYIYIYAASEIVSRRWWCIESLFPLNPHLGLINVPPLFCFSLNDLFHYSFTIKKARNRLNVGQFLFTIHLLSKRPGRGAWDFINGGGLLIRGGD